MSNDNLRTQERIARDEIHDALYLGTDVEGAAHFWSSYHRTFAVVEADNAVETFHIDETPYSRLSEWVAHIETKRGWLDTPNVITGLTEGLDRAVTCE